VSALDSETLALLRAIQRAEVTAQAYGVLPDLKHHLDLTRLAVLDELGLDPIVAHRFAHAFRIMARQSSPYPQLAVFLGEVAGHAAKIALMLTEAPPRVR
jgi:hypothetical protein